MCLDYYKCFRIGYWETYFYLMYVSMLWYVGKYWKDVVTFNVKKCKRSENEDKGFNKG
jgi:hypothetical protein